MSSGKGDLSRLYKTTDGCKPGTSSSPTQTKTASGSAIQFDGKTYGILLGDPVNGYFTIFETHDGGLHGTGRKNVGAGVPLGGAVFAASNSSLIPMARKCLV